MDTFLNNLTILLVDDHAVVRMGFRLLLEGAGVSRIIEADCGETVLSSYDKEQPDVVVMDISMPGMGGLAALVRLRALNPAVRVLMLSAHYDTVIPLRALKAGALGYLSKRCQPEELIKAINQVSRSQLYLDPELAQSLALARLTGGTDPADILTDKELLVFLHLAQGRSVHEVAHDFYLSPSTVGTHLFHIKQKLNVRNGAEMTIFAMRSGLIEG
jgi:two-component system invasion response regulator UvrY